MPQLGEKKKKKKEKQTQRALYYLVKSKLAREIKIIFITGFGLLAQVEETLCVQCAFLTSQHPLHLLPQITFVAAACPPWWFPGDTNQLVRRRL